MSLTTNLLGKKERSGWRRVYRDRGNGAVPACKSITNALLSAMGASSNRPLPRGTGSAVLSAGSTDAVSGESLVSDHSRMRTDRDPHRTKAMVTAGVLAALTTAGLPVAVIAAIPQLKMKSAALRRRALESFGASIRYFSAGCSLF